MTESRHERVHRIFTEAVALPREQVDAYLDEHCGDDAELRAEVEAMLEADARSGATFDVAVEAGAGQFLVDALGDMTSDATPEVTRSEAAPEARMPERIGQYDVRRLIGRGGMGTVYEAEQDTPRRRVALKVINAGVTSPELLRRFEIEAEILGRLQHPGIAQIFEAGTFDQGSGAQPFFAMELVDGDTLERYAERHELGNRERLALLAQVCDAVEHAHQRGVIHRDLKPSNILVDAHGQPKILDFGVARATDADVQTATLRTDVGQLVGTIPYMSPEQASGDPKALDTRSDVYALGVVAYQLLTNRLPYDLGKKMIHEAVRVIQEEDPRPLSTVDRVFRGDVEIIVGKTLAKEKERRYQSAGDLASDIRRYLMDEPIDARPPSARYQLGKFARRNKALVTGVVAVFVALIGGLIGISLALAQSRANEQRALTEATKSDRVAEFSKSMLSGIDPETAKDMDTRLLLMILDEAARRAETELTDQPEVEAEIRDTIGSAYTSIGEYDAAEGHYAAAVATRRAQLGDDDSDTLVSIANMAALLRLDGRLDESSSLHEEAVDGMRRLHGDEHPYTLSSRAGRGHLLLSQGHMEEAEAEFRAVLDARRRVLPIDDPETLRVQASLGTVLRIRGKLDDAARELGAALDGYRRIFDADEDQHHPQMLSTAALLGGVQTDRGEFEEAGELLREAVAGQRIVLGSDHPNTIGSIGNLAGVMAALGKYDEAETLYREAAETARRELGDDHPETLVALNNYAHALRDIGRFDEAERYMQLAVDGSRRILGLEHRETLMAMTNLGGVLNLLRRFDDAGPVLEEALEASRGFLGDEHPVTVLAVHNLASARRAQGRLDEAEALAREAVERYRRLHGNDHPETHGAIETLASLYQDRGEYDKAEPLFRESYDGKLRLLGPDHPLTLRAVNNLGYLLKSAGQLEEALPLYRTALQAYRDQLGDQHPSTLISINNLGSLLETMGEMDEAETLFREALAGRRVALGVEHPYTISSMYKLVNVLWPEERYDEALPLMHEAIEVRRGIEPLDEAALATLLAWAGANEIERNGFEAAEARLRECLEIRERIELPVSWLLANTRSMYGETLTGLERYDEAEPLLTQASVDLDADATTPPDRRTDARRRVVELYEAWGRPVDAEAWRDET